MSDASENLLQLVRQLDVFRLDGTLCDVTVLVINRSEERNALNNQSVKCDGIYSKDTTNSTVPTSIQSSAKCDSTAASQTTDACRDHANDIDSTNSKLDELVTAKFQCHRCVLAASSAYWRSMFAHDVRETRTRTVRFDADVVSPRAFAQLLDYVYTGRLRMPQQYVDSLENQSPTTESSEYHHRQQPQQTNSMTSGLDATIEVLELLNAAHLLNYETVVNQCATFLDNSIDTRTCVMIGRHADHLGLTALAGRAHRFIVQHFTAVYIDTHDITDEERDNRLAEISVDQVAAYAADDELAIACEADLLAFVYCFFTIRAKRGLVLRSSDLLAVLRHVRLDCIRAETLRRFHALFNTMFSPSDGVDNLDLQHITALFNEAVASNSTEQGASQRPRGQETQTTAQPSNGTSSKKRPPRASTIKRDAIVLLSGFANPSLSAAEHQFSESMFYVDTTVRVFDAQRSTWRILTNLPRATRWCAVASISNSLYVLGGLVHVNSDTANSSTQSFDFRPARPKTELIDSVWRYDVLCNRWTECAPMPRVRAQHCACVIGAHIYVLGGVTRRAANEKSANASPSRNGRELDVDGELDVRMCTEIDCFDTNTGTWLIAGESSQARRLSHLVSISLLSTLQCERDDDSYLSQPNGTERRCTATAGSGCTIPHNGERAARNGPANCTHALIEIGGLRTSTQSSSIDTFEYYTVTGPYFPETYTKTGATLPGNTNTSCSTVINGGSPSVNLHYPDANTGKLNAQNLEGKLRKEQVVRVDSSGEHFVLPETLRYPLAVAFDENTLFLLCEQTRKLVSFEPKRRTYKRLPDLPTSRIGCALVVCNGRLYVLGGYAPVAARRGAAANQLTGNENASSPTNNPEAFHVQAQRTSSNGNDSALICRHIDLFRRRLAAFSERNNGACAEDNHGNELGSISEEWQPSGLVECFDPASEHWCTVAEMQLPTPRACHLAATLRL